MKNDPKQVLIDVLSIVGYADDKNNFVDEFFFLCTQQAILQLLSKLPADKQAQLKAGLDKLIGVKDASVIVNAATTIKEYLSEQEYNLMLQEVTKENFIAYIDTVTPTLRPEQKVALDKYLATIATPAAS